MLPLTIEWVSKAEGDYETMLRERRARKSPNHDAACFHAQQCIEKYLKASLQELGVPFMKTHDLVLLLDTILPQKPEFVSLRFDLNTLTNYSVDYRYPGLFASNANAAEAARICRYVRSSLRSNLGI